MKFSQLKEHKKKIFFSKNHAENEGGRLVQTSFFLIKKKKALYELKVSGLQLSFNMF